MYNKMPINAMTEKVPYINLKSIFSTKIPAITAPTAIPKSKPNKNVAIAFPLFCILAFAIAIVCNVFIPIPVPIPAIQPEKHNVIMFFKKSSRIKLTKIETIDISPNIKYPNLLIYAPDNDLVIIVAKA